MDCKYVLFYTIFYGDHFYSKHKFFKDKDKIIEFIAHKKISLDNIILYKKTNLF